MTGVEVRKTATYVETIHHDSGPAPATPLRQGWIGVVIRNPFAGRYVEDIAPYMDELKPLAVRMARELVAALGGDPSRIETYGKGAIVGVNGEIEHGALWHNPGGNGMREVLGGAKAIVPSTKSIAALGGRLMVPLCYIKASSVRSHYGAIEVGIYDAPRPDEIVYTLAMGTAGRIHARLGGLAASAIEGRDGVR